MSSSLLNQFDALEELVAACATFRTLTGTSTSAAAKEHVHWPEANDTDEEEDCWPRAVIAPSKDWRAKKVGTGAWKGGGSLYLTLELEVPDAAEAETWNAQFVWVQTQIAAIEAEMRALAGTGSVTIRSVAQTHLNVMEIELVDGPFQARAGERKSPDSEAGEVLLPRWWVTFLVRWGG